METCNCKGTGFTIINNETVPCICKILRIYEAHLGIFKQYGAPTPGVISIVDRAMFRHRQEEKKAERVFNGVVIPGKKPKHWFMMDLHGSNNAFGPLGNPGKWYMQFFFQYLVSSKEFADYRLFDLVTLQNIYYEYDGGELASADTQGEGSGFYGYNCGTFLLHFKNVLPGKEAFNILRHFLDTYIDRNIIIYAESMFRETPRIRKWSEDKGEYVVAELRGEKSLQALLLTEYRDFFDLTQLYG